VSFLNNTATNDRTTGRVHSALFGIDHRVTDDLLLGVAFSVENSNVQLKTQTSRQRGNGGLVSPYAAYILSDTLIVDAQITMGRVDRNLERNRATGQTTGNYASRRLGAATNLTTYFPVEGYDLRSSIGYAYNVDRPDDFLLDDQTRVDLGTTRLGQVISNHEVSFGTGDGLVPYAGILLEYDTTRASSADRFGSVLSVGVRYGTGTDLSLGAYASTEIGRPNQSTTVLGVNARLSF
jgi:outer membrane autotransporter protein